MLASLYLLLYVLPPIDHEKVSEKHCYRLWQPSDDENTKHKQQLFNCGTLSAHNHKYTDYNKSNNHHENSNGTHFFKLFITFEYYLSMVRRSNASLVHALIFSNFLFTQHFLCSLELFHLLDRTLALFNPFRIFFIMRARTHVRVGS